MGHIWVTVQINPPYLVAGLSSVKSLVFGAGIPTNGFRREKNMKGKMDEQGRRKVWGRVVEYILYSCFTLFCETEG